MYSQISLGRELLEVCVIQTHSFTNMFPKTLFNSYHLFIQYTFFTYFHKLNIPNTEVNIIHSYLLLVSSVLIFALRLLFFLFAAAKTAHVFCKRNITLLYISWNAFCVSHQSIFAFITKNIQFNSLYMYIANRRFAIKLIVKNLNSRQLTTDRISSIFP